MTMKNSHILLIRMLLNFSLVVTLFYVLWSSSIFPIISCSTTAFSLVNGFDQLNIVNFHNTTTSVPIPECSGSIVNTLVEGDDHLLDCFTDISLLTTMEGKKRERENNFELFQTNNNSKESLRKLTLVLCLRLNDMDRALILLQSLHEYFDSKSVYELIIVVPDKHFKVLSILETFSFSFPTRVYKDSEILLNDRNINERTTDTTTPKQHYHGTNQLEQHEGYAIQMMVKLYISQYVKTPFYLTLDADVLAIGPITYSDLIYEYTEEVGQAQPKTIENVDEYKDAETVIQKGNKAYYTYEEMEAHPHWWLGSAEILNFTEEEIAYFNEKQRLCQHVREKQRIKGDRIDIMKEEEVQANDQLLSSSCIGFGVTPSVLSTFGARLTIETLYERLKSAKVSEMEKNNYFYSSTVLDLLSRWGKPHWWSEYTLYTLTLEMKHVFHLFHFPINDDYSNYKNKNYDYLTCPHSVWFEADVNILKESLKDCKIQNYHEDTENKVNGTLLNADNADTNNERKRNDQNTDKRSMFIVVQSTSKLSASMIAAVSAQTEAY